MAEPKSPVVQSSSAIAPWFRKGDAILLAVLLGVVSLAWCTANAKWSLSQWSLPNVYLEVDKADVVHALAMMKAGGDGQFVPLAWKVVDDIGAPAGANWNDWPLIEELLVVFYAGLGRIFGLFGGLNVGTLIAHLLAVVTFYVVARSEACAPVWSFVGSLAYGLAPFIFAQSPFHITTEYVWHIPLFVPVWRWVSTEPGIRPGSRQFWSAVAVGVVTGLQSPYWTNIFCQLTLLGAAVMFWRNRSWPALKSALAVIGAAAAAFALMNLDTWTYKLANGPNPGALVREYKWLEIYGLKLVDLVIPPVAHRSNDFAAYAAAHRLGNPAAGIPPASPLQDEGSYLGIVGILALGLLVWTAISDAVKGRANDIPLAAWQVLWIMLCFSTGGLNAILGACGFTLFRAACRYSVVILAIVLMDAVRRLTAWEKDAAAKASADTMRIGTLTAAAGLCLLILWDQVPRAPTPAQSAVIAKQVAADREFVGRMEESLPDKAMVFQLPVMEFPESGLPGIPPYDHFRPYLYSHDLRFSFGSMKGRERERWQQAVQQKLVEGAAVDQQAQKIRFKIANVNQAVQELETLGFKAIYINRNGFPDRGKGLEEALVELGFDTPPLRSAAGDLTCILLEKRPAAEK